MNTSKLKERMSNKLQSSNTKLQTVEKESTTAEIINMPTGVISDYVALTSNALSIISENLKNQQLSPSLFDVVKSPSGGTTAFSVPGLAGDEIEKELVGIILDYTTPRAYWDTPDPIEGTPPVCFSRDSIISHEGEPCNLCAFNDFGSKNGESNGKACKESVHIFLLRPDNILPLIVRVPVSSKNLFLKYTTRLVSNLTPVSGVVTKITLEKATNKTGQPYALYNFEAIAKLSSEETAMARTFGQKFMEIMNISSEPEISEIA